MEILEEMRDVVNVVEEKAKYQKVMVIFDSSVSNVEVDNLYREIKEICIFNKSAFEDLDLNELYNGYKIIIYFCSAESFLKLNFNRDEFINIYIPTGNIFLPFCLDDNCYLTANYDYILFNGELIDVNVQTSLLFNKFYNYMNSVISLKTKQSMLSFNYNLTEISMLNNLCKSNNDLEFVDIKILKNTNIDYCNLQILQLLLIDAFLVFISNVKNKTLSIVDVYKSCKEDYGLIDKFYAMANNEGMLMTICLNYNSLYNVCLKTKESILNHCYNLDENEVESVISELKNFAKNDDGLIGYLYLYNLFNV